LAANNNQGRYNNNYYQNYYRKNQTREQSRAQEREPEATVNQPASMVPILNYINEDHTEEYLFYKK